MTMQDFSEIEALVAKQSRMESLIARHNHLAAMLPKVITAETESDVRLIRVEMNDNLRALQQIMADIEAECAQDNNTPTLVQRIPSGAA
jgi:hypothetical protein